MKNVSVLILVILVVAAAMLFAFSFQVRETEKALVTRFGEHKRTIETPGWCWRLPAVEKVYKFDSRNHLFTGVMEETTTKGGETINVTSYIIWKIAEPLRFFNSVETVKEAENKLRSQLKDTQNRIVGQYSFSEFVNSDKSKIKIEEIEQKMLSDLQLAVRDNYGIEVKAFGIKQLKINEEVSKDVFERMRAERNHRTETTVSEGQAEAAKIKTDADSKKAELLATAQARATAIRGQGDAEAAQYYKLLEADPEFAMFLRNIEALKKILKERSTIVFSADTEPFTLLKTIPTLEPKK